MKGNAFKLRRGYWWGLAVLVVAAAGVMLVATSSSAQDDDPCYFSDGTHRGSFDGLGAFTLSSEELVSAAVGTKFIDRDGRIVTPIRIRGLAGRGQAEGIGETVYWLDTSRPVTSGIRSKQRGQEFPAVHEMGFHLFLTTEALPGKIFRSINPAIMVNENSTSFPPKLGSSYALKSVVEFEDVAEPGIVAARIESNHNRYVGSGRAGLSRLHEN